MVPNLVIRVLVVGGEGACHALSKKFFYGKEPSIGIAFGGFIG